MRAPLSAGPRAGQETPPHARAAPIGALTVASLQTRKTSQLVAPPVRAQRAGMRHLLEEPVSDPLPLYRYRDGISAVDLLAAAIAHLDFFTWLGSNPATPGAVCAHFGLHPRPVDVM